jgi:hypothetical protein
MVQSAGALPPLLLGPPALPARPASRIAPPPVLDSPPPPPPSATSAPADSRPVATSQAEARIKLLKAHVEQSEFSFFYVGPTDKPFYAVTLSVPDFMIQDDPQQFVRKERITAAQGEKIIEVLAASGWLAEAEEGIHIINTEPPPWPGYRLTLMFDKTVLAGPLGFDLKMLRQLDAIRVVLDGDGAKAMGLLIKRMAGLRKQWEAAEKPARP